MSRKPLRRNSCQKTTGLGFTRGLFKSPNLTGCFPPKPPARFLMHSDHRRDGKKQQEYRGNKREGLDRGLYRSCFSAAQNAAMQDECSGKNLNLTMRDFKIKERQIGKILQAAYSGKKIEKTVPVCPGATQLRKRMLPPCFCTISRDTQRPSPVPTSSLVV
jgi:hypothetical protein